MNMMIEVKTLTEHCGHECDGADLTHDGQGWKCSKMWLCRYGAEAVCRDLLTRCEELEHEAYKKDIAGQKEHVVWMQVIKMIEEYL